MADFPDVADPGLYRSDGWRPHFARLRREDPVHYHPENPDGPHLSVTRYSDIMAVGPDHRTHLSAFGPGGVHEAAPPQRPGLPHFICMDPPPRTVHPTTARPL